MTGSSGTGARIVGGFVCGALSVLFFHQSVLALLHAAGLSARGAYATQPTGPLAIPQLLSLAFWGGVWGILLVLAIARLRRTGYWIGALLFGAVLPTVVAWFVVAPLKHQPVAGGFKPAAMLTAIVINAAWGLGTAFLLWLAAKARVVAHAGPASSASRFAPR